MSDVRVSDVPVSEVPVSDVPVLELPGLAGQNPLGFLATLGLLRVLDHHARAAAIPPPALGFEAAAPHRARVRTALPFDALKQVVLEDAAAQTGSPVLTFAYTAEGEVCSSSDPAAVRDLKGPPHHVARLLDAVAAAGASRRRDADLAAALFCESVTDGKGQAKPTALHFTAGQQAFLAMVDELRRGIQDADLEEALRGPWTNRSKLPSLGWDSSSARAYALRATDPAGEKRGSVPAANWLALQGLAYLPVYPGRRGLQTTGVRGGWKNGVFTWPLWTVLASSPVVASLLRIDLRRWSAREREAAAVVAVLASAIQRSDRYGSFSPAAVVLPGQVER